MKPEMALDRQIILDYLRFLLDRKQEDTPESRKRFCEEAKVHPKLLYYNPHMGEVSKLFTQQSNFERLQDMTLREYMRYHYYYVHRGVSYGAAEMQQTWLGHDIIKSPFDCWIYQELIYKVRPDVVLELGVMFGGASHFFASILDLVDHGIVLGIDITLAKVKEIINKRIHYIEGSSVSEEVFEQVRRKCEGKKVLVIADSDHEKNHVLRELQLYSRFVPVGSYFVVEDSLNDVMGYHPVPNEGPQAAARQFLQETDCFVPDLRYAEKYVLSINPLGYLLRVK
jgi:cephalosporin hydroxylase